MDYIKQKMTFAKKIITILMLIKGTTYEQKRINRFSGRTITT